MSFTRGIGVFFTASTVLALNGVANAAIVDSSFELGQFGGAWAESSTNFGTTICSIPLCGTGGGTGPYDGDYWSWFGGINTYEAGSVSQNATFEVGRGTLTFYFELPVVSGNAFDYLNLVVDGHILWSASGADTPFVGYIPISIDVSAFADGGVHNVAFESEIFGLGAVGTSFFVDKCRNVPAPGSLAVLGFGGTFAIRRR